VQRGGAWGLIYSRSGNFTGVAMGQRRKLGTRVMVLALGAAWAVAGCDVQKIDKLEEGLATEADVRAQFGEPAVVYTDENGERTFEYPRQPEGHRNYMVTIGADGRMSALRQVLTPANFARVTPGLDKAQVRRLLGLPGKTQVYALKNEEVWDWRFLDGAEGKLFSVTFDANGVVLGSAVMLDPRTTHSGG